MQDCKLMNSIMEVEIQSKKWIKPATPTPPHLHNYQLSSIDQLVPSYFVQPIFYFDVTRETTDQLQTTPGRLLHLEESLSKVLTLYYPFAGRIYDEDDSLVSCQDQGVAFVVATVDRKLDEYLVDGEYDSKVLFSGLVENPGTSNPVVLVQVNIFTCGGVAIGLSFNHKVGDMFTISTFMNAWATTSRLGTLDKVVHPSFSFSSLLPPSDLHFPKPQLSGINTVTLPKYVMKRYMFTGEAIAKMRSSINDIEMSYTRVELVVALICRSFTKLARAKQLMIAQAMNLRSRTGLPIEDNSCGNLLVFVRATCGELDNNGLQWELPKLAKLVKNSIKNVSSEMIKVREWSKLSEKVVNATVEYLEEIKKGENVNVVVRFSSWCRFGLYEVDFGWGRPTLVSTAPTPSNCIFLMDCKSDEGGIEALVCLKEQDMAFLQQQSNIVEYA